MWGIKNQITKTTSALNSVFPVVSSMQKTKLELNHKYSISKSLKGMTVFSTISGFKRVAMWERHMLSALSDCL